MKWVKRLALAAVLLVVVAGIVVFLYLNSIIRSEVQDQATASLNVPTTLSSASLSIFGGSLSLSDLEVGSPPNFSSPHTLTLGDCSMTVHYSELEGTPIHVVHVTIDNPVLFVELSNLKLNLQALMDQIPQSPTTGGGEPKQPTKLIIDQLDLNNAQVNFLPGLPGLSARIPVTIPSLTLKNIGNANGNQNGAAIKEVVMQVVTALAAKAGDNANLPPQLKALLSTNLGSLSNQLGTEFSKQFQGVAGSLGNILGNGSAGGKDAVNNVGNALNGLLGSDKKKGQ